MPNLGNKPSEKDLIEMKKRDSLVMKIRLLSNIRFELFFGCFFLGCLCAENILGIKWPIVAGGLPHETYL